MRAGCGHHDAGTLAFHAVLSDPLHALPLIVEQHVVARTPVSAVVFGSAPPTGPPRPLSV